MESITKQVVGLQADVLFRKTSLDGRSVKKDSRPIRRRRTGSRRAMKARERVWSVPVRVQATDDGYGIVSKEGAGRIRRTEHDRRYIMEGDIRRGTRRTSEQSDQHYRRD